MTNEYYLNLLSPGNRLKPRFSALVASVVDQVVDMFNLIEAFPVTLSFEQAEGAQLDTIGSLLGMSRPGSVSDDDYRLLLRSRIAKLHWDGTNDSLPHTLELAFPDRIATVMDNCDGTVSLSLSGEAPIFPLRDLFPVPMGIDVV